VVDSEDGSEATAFEGWKFLDAILHGVMARRISSRGNDMTSETGRRILHGVA
jgi:hypothetical protein